jgi:hypothetical protein
MSSTETDDQAQVDEQDRAEMFDEDVLDDDQIGFTPWPPDGRVHGVIGSPDQLGADDIAELVADEFPADDQLAPEEAAMHVEEH